MEKEPQKKMGDAGNRAKRRAALLGANRTSGMGLLGPVSTVSKSLLGQ
jgi:hypothetical protein